MTDKDLIKEAYLEALRNSTDPSTQNGAVIVFHDDLHIKGGYKKEDFISKGANHFPRDVKESPERWERPLKYSFVEHAERNAIFNAAKSGSSTYGATMYCPWFACADCARAIIQAGIVEVVGHDCPIHTSASKTWKDSVEIGLTMFREAGVSYRYVSGEVGLHIRFNGEVVKV